MNLCASFNLECAHSIEAMGMPVLHGHSYVVTVCVASSPDKAVPLPDLQGWAAEIQKQLDHRNLNDVLDCPTMEAIVRYVRRNWPGPELRAVRVARPTIGASAEWAA